MGEKLAFKEINGIIFLSVSMVVDIFA